MPSERWTVHGAVAWRHERTESSWRGSDRVGVSHTYSQGLQIQVIDLDRFDHDLIAQGRLASDGTFSVSFGREEFNLDRFENEDWPELWIVVSRETADGFVPVESFGLPRSRWVGHTIDVGRIELNPMLLALPDGERVADADGGGRARVSLEGDSLREHAELVRPEVERLTGWTIDLSDIGFVAASDFGDLMLADLTGSGIEVPWYLRFAMRTYFAGSALGGYGATSRAVGVSPQCSRLSSESLQVILGHELVHVGQFAHVPNLLERLQTALGDLLNDQQMLDSDAAGIVDVITSSELWSIKVALEGQATWVQQALQSTRPLAGPIEPDPSLAGRLVMALASRFGPTDAEQLRGEQYRVGLQAARESSIAGAPATLPEWLTGGH